VLSSSRFNRVVCIIETLKQNLLTRCLLFMVLREAEVVHPVLLLLVQLLLQLLHLVEEMEEAEEVFRLWLML